jgi:hypothetical protein
MSNPQSMGELPPELKAYLLDLLDQQIEADERKLPCWACTLCEWATCHKAVAYRCRRWLLRGEYLAEAA